MVLLWILRYHTTQHAYSISFPARQYCCSDTCGWDSHVQRATSRPVWNRFHVSWHRWQSGRCLPPQALWIRIGSRADTTAGWPWGGVACFSNMWPDTRFNICIGYHSRFSLTMPVMSLCGKITHSWRVFPHKMDSGNPITTFSVTNLQSIATTTEVKVFPRPMSSAIRTPGISASQTHILTICHMTQTWFARNLDPDRPGIEYLWPATQSSIDWPIWWAFSSLTAFARHSCSDSSLILLITVFNTVYTFAGSRTSSPSSTSSWTSFAPLSVFLSFSMNSFSCSNVSWADGIIFWRSWISLRCLVFHWQATIGTNIYGCNTINSILSIRTYVNTSIILLPTILLSLLCSTLFRTFESLCIMISSFAHLASTWLEGITFAGLLTCSPIFVPEALFISVKSIPGLCASFNFKASERQQLYQILPYMESCIICPFVYNPIYSSSCSSCSKLNQKIDVRMYGPCKVLFLSNKSISFFKCLTSVHEDWSCYGLQPCSCHSTPSKSQPWTV